MAEAKAVVAEKKEDASGEKKTGMAIFTYFIFFIPFLTGDDKDSFVKFHMKQSIILVIALVLVNVVGGLIPFIGWFLIIPLGDLIIFVLFILGVMNASKGEEKELPVIGKYAKEFLKF